MKPIIRICISCLNVIYYLNSNQEIDGILKDYVSFYIENQFKDYNRSLFCESRVGTKIGPPNSEGPFIYNGCLARIQENKSDYLYGSVTQPVLGQNLVLSGVFGESDHSIISIYKPTDMTIKNTILLSFNSPWSLQMKCYFVLFQLLFFFVLHWFFRSGVFRRGHQIIKRKRDRPVSLAFNVILGTLLKQWSCYVSMLIKKRKIIRPLIIVMVIFNYLFLFILCSLLKTDLVTSLDPETIETYKKIVDSNGKILPVFINTLTEYEAFEFASEGTMRRELWKHILKQKGGKSRSLVSGQGVLNSIEDIRQQKAVVLASINDYQHVWDTNICTVLKSQGKRDNVLILRDPFEEMTLTKMVVRRTSKDESTDIFKPADRIMNSFFEMGINLKTYDLQNYALAINQDLNPEDMRVCLSNVIQTPKKDFVDKDLTSFLSLFYVFFGFVLCWLLVLLIEVCVRKIE